MNSKRNKKYEGAKPSRLAPAFHTMTGRFSSCLFLAVYTLSPQTIAAQASDPESPAGEIRGAVTSISVQGDATALEGVLVNLSAGSHKPAPWSTLSDADGHFQFAGLSAGTYLLDVSQTGFKPFTATIVLQPKESRVQDIRLELATVASSIDVQGQASEITAHSADPDTTLTERELPALPMAQQKFTEALPLIPGVVRTMNGVLNIKGEVANQGMLLVDAAQMVDPVTGGFSVGVPLTSIETLNVFEAPYNSQYGGFSGGLATIETKAPPSQWQYSLLDFVPGLRMKKRHIFGVSAETPRLFLGGPLIRNRLNISESFDYTIKNTPVRGQPWPVNENRLKGFTSFTNLQAVLSPRHLLSASVTAFSSRYAIRRHQLAGAAERLLQLRIEGHIRDFEGDRSIQFRNPEHDVPIYAIPEQCIWPGRPGPADGPGRIGRQCFQPVDPNGKPVRNVAGIRVWPVRHGTVVTI